MSSSQFDSISPDRASLRLSKPLRRTLLPCGRVPPTPRHGYHLRPRMARRSGAPYQDCPSNCPCDSNFQSRDSPTTPTPPCRRGPRVPFSRKRVTPKPKGQPFIVSSDNESDKPDNEHRLRALERLHACNSKGRPVVVSSDDESDKGSGATLGGLQIPEPNNRPVIAPSDSEPGSGGRIRSSIHTWNNQKTGRLVPSVTQLTPAAPAFSPITVVPTSTSYHAPPPQSPSVPSSSGERPLSSDEDKSASFSPGVIEWLAPKSACVKLVFYRHNLARNRVLIDPKYPCNETLTRAEEIVHKNRAYSTAKPWLAAYQLRRLIQEMRLVHRMNDASMREAYLTWNILPSIGFETHRFSHQDARSHWFQPRAIAMEKSRAFCTAQCIFARAPGQQPLAVPCPDLHYYIPNHAFTHVEMNKFRAYFPPGYLNVNLGAGLFPFLSVEFKCEGIGHTLHYAENKNALAGAFGVAALRSLFKLGRTVTNLDRIMADSPRIDTSQDASEVDEDKSDNNKGTFFNDAGRQAEPKERDQAVEAANWQPITFSCNIGAREAEIWTHYYDLENGTFCSTKVDSFRLSRPQELHAFKDAISSILDWATHEMLPEIKKVLERLPALIDEDETGERDGELVVNDEE